MPLRLLPQLLLLSTTVPVASVALRPPPSPPPPPPFAATAAFNVNESGGDPFVDTGSGTATERGLFLTVYIDVVRGELLRLQPHVRSILWSSVYRVG